MRIVNSKITKRMERQQARVSIVVSFSNRRPTPPPHHHPNKHPHHLHHQAVCVFLFLTLPRIGLLVLEVNRITKFKHCMVGFFIRTIGALSSK